MMASIAKPLFPAASTPQMRPFDARRDLQTVADLIELGFSETLDDEGLRYLSQMRATATSYKQFGWLGIAGYLGNFSMAGYVWEEAGQLVGNLNLIPYLAGARRNYLIANVVVHPNYRRKGIGRALTVRAIEQARTWRAGCLAACARRKPGSDCIVRIAGLCRTGPAYYLDFPGGSPKPELADDILIGPRRAALGTARAWLQSNYPQELLWNLPLKINSLHPGLFGGFSEYSPIPSISGQYSGVENYARLQPGSLHKPAIIFFGWLRLGTPMMRAAVFAGLCSAKYPIQPPADAGLSRRTVGNCASRGRISPPAKP